MNFNFFGWIKAAAWKQWGALGGVKGERLLVIVIPVILIGLVSLYGMGMKESYKSTYHPSEENTDQPEKLWTAYE